MRMRFEPGELALLHSAEQLRGTQLARGPARPDALRAALALAKAGRKLTSAGPGAAVSLDESEVRLLREAVEMAGVEVHWLSQTGEHEDPEPRTAQRQQAVRQAFPELVERGLWRAFGVCRELETLGRRLDAALHAGGPG